MISMISRNQITVCIIAFLMGLSGCALPSDSRFKSTDGGVDSSPGLQMMRASDLADAKINQNRNSDEIKAVVTLHVVGRGIAPENAINKGQAIILGQSAARSNGYVKLAEKIHGVYIDSFRKIGRGVVDVEIVHQETEAYLRGAEVLEYKEAEYGIFEAYMRVRIIVNKNHPLFPIGT